MAFTPQKNGRLLGFQVQGDLGPLTMYTSVRQQIVVFMKSPPKEPASWRQVINRNRYRAAAATWRALTSTQKSAYERATKRLSLGLSGYALWVHWQTIHDLAGMRTIERQSGITLAGLA